jgi:hypothetical protein
MSMPFRRKLLNFLRYAAVSIVLLVSGSMSAGLLYREQNLAVALFLLMAALLSGYGSIYFFFKALRTFWPKQKENYLSTFH